jgi:hypothetical protein
MNYFWNIVQGWEPIGQGIFLLAILGMAFGTVQMVFRHFVILVRGWPPCKCSTASDEDDNPEDDDSTW